MLNRKQWASVLVSAAMLLTAAPLPAAAGHAAEETVVLAEEAAAETTAVAETTTAETTNTAETTTTQTTAAVPQISTRISAVCTDGYPSGETELHLYLAENPGLEAIGVTLTLPEILLPDADAEGRVLFDATGALSDAAYAYYVPETHRLSLAYAAAEPGEAAEDLGCFHLHISEEAVIGTGYPITVKLDLLSADGLTEAECEEQTVFSPTEPLLRTLSETALTLTEQGGSYPLTLSPEPPEGSCIWESSDPEIVSVDENGVLTAYANGEATVTVTCEMRSYTCDVTVQIDRQLVQTELAVDALSETLHLALEPEPLHAVTWRSETENIVAVTSDGTVSVLSCGTAVIVAVGEETEYRFTVPALIRRALNYTEYTFTDTDDVLRLTLSPASRSPIIWFTDNADVARVSAAGLVTPHSNGTATLIASCEGYDFYCKITVDIPMHLNYESYAAKEIGDTLQLALIPSPDPDDGAVTWESSDPEVAAVDENGLVTFLAHGTADISAAYMEQQWVCAVTVQTYLRGDVNDDGTVDAIDAMLALQAYSQVYLTHYPSPLTAVQQRAADVDEDETVSLFDAMAILRYYGMTLVGFNPTWEDAL